MNTYYKEIDAFVKSHLNLVKVLRSIPETETEHQIFDSWNLKQLVIHMTNWNQLITQNVIDLKKGKIPKHYGRVQEVNEDAVKNAEIKNWANVFDEFNQSGIALFSEYLTLQDDMFGKVIWEGKSSTLLKFLKIVTDHYTKEHIPQVTAQLKRIKTITTNFAELLNEAVQKGYNIGICASIVNEKNEILLLERSKSDEYTGIWEMPGGSVEKGENLREAVKREVEEEAGLQTENEPFIFDYFEFYNIETGKYKRKFCLKVEVNSQSVINLSPDHDNYKWFNAESLKKELIPQSKDNNYNVWDDHFQIAIKSVEI